jgi:hypothetical protein
VKPEIMPKSRKSLIKEECCCQGLNKHDLRIENFRKPILDCTIDTKDATMDVYETRELNWLWQVKEREDMKGIPSQEPSFQKKTSPQAQAPMPSLVTSTSEAPRGIFSLSDGAVIVTDASDTAAEEEEDNDDDDGDGENRRWVAADGELRGGNAEALLLLSLLLWWLWLLKRC